MPFSMSLDPDFRCSPLSVSRRYDASQRRFQALSCDATREVLLYLSWKVKINERWNRWNSVGGKLLDKCLTRNVTRCFILLHPGEYRKNRCHDTSESHSCYIKLNRINLFWSIPLYSIQVVEILIKKLFLKLIV